MKVGIKLSHEELQIEFNYRRDWPTFSKLLPFVQNPFSRLIYDMLSDTRINIGSKIPYEELQIKFDFR